ncbi:MAG: tetratricopeptide repeat protein, partial [Deefgea sp.]
VIPEIVAPATVAEVPFVEAIKKDSAESVTIAPPPITSPSPPTQPQAIAKGLFAKSKKQPTRGLLPWLLLGAGLLLAGMVAWFAWQYRQLTQPIPKVEVREPIAAVASPVASELTYIAEEITDNSIDVDTHATPAPVEEPKPAPAVVTRTPEKLAAKPNLVAKGISDHRDLNPPLKFVRQSPNLAGPDPVLLAWQFYQNGDLNQAELFYQKALQADPRQRDALLGLAAIAQQRGDLNAAAALYQRILRANPQDQSAKAALMLLNSAQMPEHEAVQLEQSGQSDPMVLGQYFAAQQRWSQAQEQFFLAYSANPNSADAALNLAVSLDHLKQTNLAKTYYRKALQTKETIHFDRSKVEQRLAELDAASGVAP